MKIRNLAFCIGSALAFNFETRWPIVKKGAENSHFGYAVDAFKYNDGKWSIIVGAPTDKQGKN
jgi:hypothetical protein